MDLSVGGGEVLSFHGPTMILKEQDEDALIPSCTPVMLGLPWDSGSSSTFL